MSKGAVLVAGGAGYIGSHVCKALAAQGYLPVTLDNLSTGHRRAVRYGPLIEGDIACSDSVRRAVTDFGVEGVMHFAAKSQVAESLKDPLTYYAENVGKGVAFLQHLGRNRIQAVLFSSTAAVYGNPATAEGLTEASPTRPINPYGASKLAFENALRWSTAASGGRLAILRYFNAAGAAEDGELGEDHDPETHLIPLIIGAALGSRPPVQVFGTDYDTPDGSALRDYIHVSDLAAGHLMAYARMLAGEVEQTYNAGAGRGTSVLQVIRAVSTQFGTQVPHVLKDRREGDPPALVANIDKFCSAGWRPALSDLQTIVETAARWHSSQLHTMCSPA